MHTELTLSDILALDTPQVWITLKRINNPPQLFLMNGAVQWLMGDSGTRACREVNATVLRRFITEHIDVYRIKNKIRFPANPQPELCTNMLAGPPPDLPRLRGILRVPVFTDNGLITKPGYDPGSGLYYDPPPDFRLHGLPEDPSNDDVAFALERLDELLGDFPFIGRADKAHAIAALLLPFVRPLIFGPTPLHLIWKPKPGMGATLLARMIANVSCDKPMLFNPSEDESEQKRVLHSILMQAPGVVILDNIRSLEGRGLSSLLTDTNSRDRTIGTSQITEAENLTLWMANGNNPKLNDENVRRVIPIGLDAGMEHPEMRKGFKHPDLPSWARKSRSSLIWSALTIIQRWYVAGRPPGRETIGSFESWALTMGGILASAGIEGFLENYATFRHRVDSETLLIRGFVLVWAERFGEAELTVRELVPLAAELDLGREENRNIRLGKLLGTREGQRFGEWAIQKGKLGDGIRKWRLRRVAQEVDVVDES